MKIPRVRRVSPAWGAVAAALVFLVFGGLEIMSPRAVRPPLTGGDSPAYLRTAEGIAACLAHPGDALRAAGRGGFTPDEARSLGFDGWILQHTPLYLLVLGLSQALTAGEPSARFVSVLFLALLGGLLFDLGRRLFSPWVGLAACLILLAAPETLYYATALLTEIPQAFLAVLCAWLLVRFREDTSVSRSLALGLGLGALYLGKVTWRPLLPLLVVLAAWFLWTRRDRVRPLAALAAGLAAVLIPWWGGLVLLGLPLNPVAESGDDMLWLFRGNNVHLQGWETLGVGDAFTPELVEAVAETPEGAEAGPATRKAYETALLRGIGNQPLGWMALVGRKLLYFWTHPARTEYTDHALWTMPPWLDILPWLALAAAVGWALASGGGARWLPGIPALYLAVAHAGSHLVSRYNVPALPIVALYAAALPWILLRAPWVHPKRPIRWRSSDLLLPAAGGILLAVIGYAAGHPPWACEGRALLVLSWTRAAALGAAVALLFLAASRLFRTVANDGRAPARVLAAGGVALGFLVLAERGSDGDWDAFSARLEKAGDGVVQRIALPPTVDRGSAGQTHLEMDLLRSPSSDFTLEVWLGDRLAHVYVGSLGAREEDFLLDPNIYGFQERHRRLLETVSTHAAGYLDRKFERERPGLDGLRRWVRLPLHPIDLMGRDTLEVKLVLSKAGRGAYVEVFGDGRPSPDGERTFTGPAFFGNAYHLSDYRFRLLAGDRRHADYRLTRTVPLESPAAWSVFLDGERPRRDLSREAGIQGGEYRIRLRWKLPGQYVWREDGRGKRLRWVRTVEPGDGHPTGEDIRKRMAVWRDDFDGFATF